jgi:hypothetical protein
VAQGRQDADHGQPRPAVAGLRPGDRELVEQVVLQVAPLVAGQRARRQVQLHVPAAQLGLELRGADGLQDGLARQRGGQGLVDQVELELDPGHRLVAGEGVAAQHLGEGVEAALHLRPVQLAVPSTERASVDVLAHTRLALPGSRADTPGAGPHCRPL